MTSCYRMLVVGNKTISVVDQIKTDYNLPLKICCENVKNVAFLIP